MITPLRRIAPLSLLAALTVLSGCATDEVETPAPVVEVAVAPPPSPPPPVSLNSEMADSAAIYIAFMREAQQIRAGFADAEAVQSALRRGAAYEPQQLSRGMIAYGAILALQSPQFVQGVRSYATDPAGRQALINNILSNPSYAAALPGADSAAGIITATMGRDSQAMTAVAISVEEDAYTIQRRNDPRRGWATRPITDRERRLQTVKDLSAQRMNPSIDEARSLFNAAHAGNGLAVSNGYARGPYTQPVTRSLAIAALAVLGAGGEDFRSYTSGLATESGNEFCFNMSKLMLFQCLAASRPSYEDIFCIGRHVARDLATCTAQGLSSQPLSAAPAQAYAVTPSATAAPVQTPAPAPAQTGPRPYNATPN
jgi:hypothetical protein